MEKNNECKMEGAQNVGRSAVMEMMKVKSMLIETIRERQKNWVR